MTGIVVFAQAALGAILISLGGVIALPPFKDILDEKYNVQLSRGLHIALFLVLILAGGLVMPVSPSQSVEQTKTQTGNSNIDSTTTPTIFPMRTLTIEQNDIRNNETTTPTILPPMRTSICNASSCALCTPIDGCGWCKSIGQCKSGTASGSTDGTCSGFGSWAWFSNDCSRATTPTPAPTDVVEGTPIVIATPIAKPNTPAITPTMIGGNNYCQLHKGDSCVWGANTTIKLVTVDSQSSKVSVIVTDTTGMEQKILREGQSYFFPSVGIKLNAVTDDSAGFVIDPTPTSTSSACSYSTCSACNRASGCGWCKTTNQCKSGSSVDATDGTCSGSSWAWYLSDCSTTTASAPTSTPTAAQLIIYDADDYSKSIILAAMNATDKNIAKYILSVSVVSKNELDVKIGMIRLGSAYMKYAGATVGSKLRSAAISILKFDEFGKGCATFNNTIYHEIGHVVYAYNHGYTLDDTPLAESFANDYANERSKDGCV